MISFATTMLVTTGLMFLTQIDFSSQVNNMKNMLSFQNASNIQMMSNGIALLFLFLLMGTIRRGYAVIAQCSQTNIDKFDRRMFKMRCSTLAILTVMKALFNQETILSDICMV